MVAFSIEIIPKKDVKNCQPSQNVKSKQSTLKEVKKLLKKANDSSSILQKGQHAFGSFVGSCNRMHRLVLFTNKNLYYYNVSITHLKKSSSSPSSIKNSFKLVNCKCHGKSWECVNDGPCSSEEFMGNTDFPNSTSRLSIIYSIYAYIRLSKNTEIIHLINSPIYLFMK